MKRTERAPIVCPHCKYIGHAHLCGCMGKLGQALEAGDLKDANDQYVLIVQRANDHIKDARGS